MSAIRRNKRFKLALIAVLVVTVIALVAREALERRVIYELPVDFHGFVDVIEDPIGGAEPIFTTEGLVVKINRSGRALIKDIEVLRKWGVVLARYEGGAPIPVYIFGVEPEDRQGLWIMPVPAGERLYQFLGTKSEVERFKRQYDKQIYSVPPMDPE